MIVYRPPEENIDNVLNNNTSKEKQFRCCFCEAAYPTMNMLERHRHETHEEINYACICGRIFKSHGEAELHKQTAHSQDASTTQYAHRCDECHKGFHQICKLKVHCETQHGNEIYTCDICQKCIKSKYNFRLHKITHEQTVVFPSKEFRSNKMQERNPFVCDICGKSVKTMASFKNHMIMHSGKKPYCCEICGKAFSRNTGVRLHRRVHTKEKPFKCDRCQKSFAWMASLNVHIDSVHNHLKPYSCNICQKKFVTKRSLKQHTEKFHDIVTTDLTANA